MVWYHLLKVQNRHAFPCFTCKFFILHWPSHSMLLVGWVAAPSFRPLLWKGRTQSLYTTGQYQSLDWDPLGDHTRLYLQIPLCPVSGLICFNSHGFQLVVSPRNLFSRKQPRCPKDITRGLGHSSGGKCLPSMHRALGFSLLYHIKPQMVVCLSS